MLKKIRGKNIKKIYYRNAGKRKKMHTALCMLLVAFILQAKCMDVDLDDNAEESSLTTTIYAGNCAMTPTQ